MKYEFKRRSGVLVPLFSVYSEKSYGIGDANALKLLVDWCVSTGNSVIQVLPLNEVGQNFCPYESVSSFALDPMYALTDVPHETQKRFLSEDSSGIKRVNYGVKDAKLSLIKDSFAKERKKYSEEIQNYRTKNNWWIEDFAAFKVLKEIFEGKPWYCWPKDYKERSSGSMRAFYSGYKELVDFEVYVQWLLFRQFRQAHDYARSKGVALMGDMPVTVNRDSADVWARKDFFNLDLVAGAPPDLFCSKGQRWGNPGMPVFRWEKIEEDGYEYLNQKLQYASEFYDMLRIDHIAGLFRIWSIPLESPMERQGIDGFFCPGDQNVWEKQGKKILSVMQENTEMLLCGEDLGTVPAVCTETMETLKIPGIDVQRWKKDWEGNRRFLPPEKYRSLSVSTLSTHDTSNWLCWWVRESTSEEKEDLLELMDFKGNPFNTGKEVLAHEALRFILDARSVFSIQLIFDWLNISKKIMPEGTEQDYRINEPGLVSRKNWSVSLPVFLEEMIGSNLNNDIRCLIKNSSRAPSE